MYGPGYGFGAAGRSRRHRAAGAAPSNPPAPLPSWTTDPAVTGASSPPTVGDVLSATGGSILNGSQDGWTWLRDNVAIAGETDSDYVITLADVGTLIRAREHAIGPGGSASHDSDPVGPVAAVDDAYTATMTLAQFPEYEEQRIFQRTTTSGGGQGKGQGSITVPLTGAVTAGTVGVRIRSAADNTILQGPWTVDVEADALSVTVSGIDARLGWFYVDLCGSDEAWQVGTVKVGMGALTVFAGQSLMVRMLGRQSDASTYASMGISLAPNISVLATYNEWVSYSPTVATMPWLTPGDVTNGTGHNSVGVGAFLNEMVALTGVNCGVIGTAQGGVPLSSFLPGNVNHLALTAILERCDNAFEAFIWGQGHTEAAAGIPAKVYEAALGRLFNAYTAINELTHYRRYVWTLPSKGLNSEWGTPSQATAIRKGAEDYCANSGATYIHADDVPLTGDGIHQGQAGSLVIAQRQARAMRSQYGANSGIGPRPLSATRSGTVITLTLSDAGQNSLVTSGTPGNRIWVFPRGRVNPLGSNATDNRFPVSAVSVVNKTTLSITLANDPGAGHELDLWVYWPSGPADAAADNIRDDITNGSFATGRVVQANLTPITIAAPLDGGAVNPPPSGFIDPISPFNMTETGSSYAPSAGGSTFGQQMTAGHAKANATPLFTPVTSEGFFTCPTTFPGGTEVLFGGFGANGGCFVGIASNGKLWGWDASAQSSTTLIPGKRYHVACQAGPGGIALYLTNITDGGSGARVYHAAYTGVVDPGKGAFALRSMAGSFTLTGGAVDEWALFNAERYSGATYAAPMTPFTGKEADIVALYRCDGNGKDVVAK